MLLNIVIAALVVAIFTSTVRIFIGPTVWDRLLGLSLISSKIILLIILFALQAGQSFYLDVALIFAILGFVGTSSIARFLRKDQ